MKELSVFVDESGEEGGLSRYYLLSLVFHDQAINLAPIFALYEQNLRDRCLPNIPFHASPLMYGIGSYEGLDLALRKSLLSSFLVLFRHLPICYTTLLYRKRAVGDLAKLGARMRRDLAIFLLGHLESFQSFDIAKIYYDGGQRIVTQALRSAFERALARQAVLYRECRPGDYRLAQVADLVCAVELTAQKYEAGEETATDRKFFGSWRTFRKNVLKDVRAKRAA